MLREAAIGRNQPADPNIEQLAAFLGPTLAAVSRIALAISSQPRATNEETRSFTRCVIVVLCDGVKRGEVNSSAMGLNENRQPSSKALFKSRHAQCQQRVDQPDGRFLSAHPVGAGVRRIALPPVLHPELQGREITCVPAYPPGPSKDRRPTESGHFP